LEHFGRDFPRFGKIKGEPLVAKIKPVMAAKRKKRMSGKSPTILRRLRRGPPYFGN
jgi:hypothetical protein